MNSGEPICFGEPSKRVNVQDCNSCRDFTRCAEKLREHIDELDAQIKKYSDENARLLSVTKRLKEEERKEMEK